jgi:hypothetical protein
MRHLLVRASIVLGFIPGLVLGPAAPADAAEAGSIPKSEQSSGQLTSPAEFLNPDGTLRRPRDFSGALDPSGWDVRLDPQRGPVFSPPVKEEPSPLASPDVGNWTAMGSGSGDIPGPVFAIALMGSDIYIGGSFRDAANNDAIDYVAHWTGTSWQPLGSDGLGGGALNGSVTSLAVSGTDLYVGGDFTDPRNGFSTVSAADYIAKWDGSNWSALGGSSSGPWGSLNAGVNAIAVDANGRVYAGGEFTNAKNGGTTVPQADYVAYFESGNWYGMGGVELGNGALNGPVYALALYTPTYGIFVGGNFTDVWDDGEPGNPSDGAYDPESDYVVIWSSGAGWEDLAAEGAGGALNNAVYALAFENVVTDMLYVGGSFTDAENYGTPLPAADYIAGVNLETLAWSALGAGSGGNGSLNGAVVALTLSGSDVYAAGYFSNVNNGGAANTAADYVARFNAGTWYSLGSDGSSGGALNVWSTSLAVNGSNVYAGGLFSQVKNSGSILGHAGHFAMFNGTNWSAVGGVQGALNGIVRAAAVGSAGAYMGGDFTNVVDSGAVVDAADYVARWDGTNWHALGSDGAGHGSLHNTVHAIAVSGSNVYVGGCFANLTDSSGFLASAGYIAKFNGTNWSALGSNGSGGPALNGCVYAIAVDGSGNVYAGGAFTDVNNGGSVLTAADYVAKFNGTNWSALGAGGGNGSLNSTVLALAVIGSDVYAGGYFDQANNGGTPNTAADYIARFNAGTWYNLGDDGGTGPSLYEHVEALAVSGTDLYVGGGFTDVNDNGTSLTAADYVAKWDSVGGAWSALGSGLSGDGSLSNYVLSLTVRGSEVYAGGYFTDVNNGGTTILEADNLAKFDGTDWSALGSDGAGDGSMDGPNPTDVNALAANGGHVYAGGRFWNVNNNGTVLPYSDFVADWHIQSPAPVDFDGDGDTDVSVFRTGSWFVRNQGVTGWGQAGDIPITADYDGDGDSDFAIYRASTGGWRVKDQFIVAYGGAVGDVPVPGDYDGDGDAAPAIFRPSTAGWYIKDQFTVGYGLSTDIPVPGDYNGDGITDIAVFRDGVWFVRDQGVTGWGQAGDIPIPGDYDGDGDTDFAVYRPSTGGWRVKDQFVVAHGGLAGDLPVPGDYDADGDTDVAIYRSSTAGWYIKDQFTVGYGLPTDYPVPARDTNGDGDPYQ